MPDLTEMILNSYASYDSGYDSIYEDGDYDWDRYQKDKDYADGDRKSTRLNSSHRHTSRMPSSA